MKSKNTALRRVWAGVAAVALGVTGAAAAGGAAMADVGPDQPGRPANGSLTIHKRVGAQGTAGTGGEIASPTGTPLNGVEFTILQLGKQVGGNCVAIDLTKVADWASVPKGKAPATLDEVKGDFCLVDPGAGTVGAPGKKVTTEGQGVATFKPADGVFGLYYVQETDSSGAKDVDGKSVNVVSKAAPFYVTIPTAFKNDWIYNVHVYPKNQTADAPTKTINSTETQTGLKVGDTVKYTITQTVPALNDGEKYTSASIYDILDPALLAYDATTSVKLIGTSTTELTATTDYTVGTSPAVSWKLTGGDNGGLSKLKAGDKIEVVFTAKVLKVTGDGGIANPGSDGEKPGYGSEFNGTNIPGVTTPYTYWGQLKINKEDNSRPGKPLKGAEFKVTAAPTDGDCPEMSETVPAAADVVAFGKSNVAGVVEWDSIPVSPLGLFVANSNNGPLVGARKDYCVYETKAPAGYTGQTVHTATIEPGSTNTKTWTAVNEQKKTPDLPLTGAAGTLAMTIGGLALVLVGGGAMVASRRRRSVES